MAPPSVEHHPRRHAAAHTDDYLYSQLIPYLGNKRKLLGLIDQGIRATGIASGTFADLFTGTTVVARLAKRRGFRVLANDWEPYSHEIALGTVVPGTPPPFAALGGRDAVFARLNALAPVDGYVARHLCPADDEHPDPDTERMFFTRANGGRIDAIREQIERWSQAGRLDPVERAHLLAPLLYAASYASNTSGVFKGFHHGWGGRTGTALHRILKPLTLKPPVLLDEGHGHLATRRDAHDLAGELTAALGARPDIVYLDPPYNQHPYGSNYHVLNTLVLWDKPALEVSTRVDGRTHNKSAIRTDWRTERRSPHNHARQAGGALADLVDRIDARRLLLSYSTDGHVPLEEVLGLLTRRGSVQVIAGPYKRYRVSPSRPSPRPHTVEFVAVADLEASPSEGRVEELAAAVRGAAAAG